jgi:hypothetical protein
MPRNLINASESGSLPAQGRRLAFNPPGYAPGQALLNFKVALLALFLREEGDWLRIREDVLKAIKDFLMFVGLVFIVAEIIMLCFPFTIAYIPLWNNTDAYAGRITSSFANGILNVRGSGFVPNGEVGVYVFGTNFFNETNVPANSAGRINVTMNLTLPSTVHVVAEGIDFVRSDIDTVTIK